MLQLLKDTLRRKAGSLAVGAAYSRDNVLESLVEAARGEMGFGLFRKLARSQVAWATYNYQGGVRLGITTVAGSAKGPTYGPHLFMVGEVKMDFGQISADRTATSAAQLAANDVLNIEGIPAGVMVPSVAVQVDTVEGGVMTANWGDTANAANYYLANVNLNALARNLAPFSKAFWYNADDLLAIQLNNNNPVKNVSHTFMLMVDLRETR